MRRMRAAAVVLALLVVIPACAGTDAGREDLPSPGAASPSGAAREGEDRGEPRRRGPDDPRPPGGPLVPVSRVVDGDTVEVLLGGSVVDVRLIGVDAPESVDPSRPVMCFGEAASDFTRRQLEGTRVRLEFDVERLDRYGRTLAYVWKDGRLFNEVLVARGFASVATYPPNVRYVDRFLAAQRDARTSGRGLWGACEGVNDEDAEAASGPGSGGPGCDGAYPDVCVAPPPPDLDCGDVAHRRFRVAGGDPHGFDGDGDGIACET